MPDLGESHGQGSLVGRSPEEYGETYQEHVIKLYEIYEKTAHDISNRRQSANSYYLTLCTSIVGFMSILGGDALISISLAVAGFSICVVWMRAIRSYREINTAKFKVIHDLEEFLPCRPYVAEWKLLDEGKNPKVYAPFSNIENYIPWIFIALLAIVLVVKVLGMFLFGGGTGTDIIV